MSGITHERLVKLNRLFTSYEIIAEGTEVFLCDMRYDYSRWSRRMVEVYGLPGEYMENAGEIWEEHIHPDDRAGYHKSIDSIFSGESVGHDMQYRALDKNGKYHTCTCRGIVLGDEDGNLEYFGGVIRDHSPDGEIDPLTGLRNQQAFFKDLAHYLEGNETIFIAMLGTTHFSRMNDLYGYDFANRILQHNARYMLEHYGNIGSLFRLDGIKLAIISRSITPEEFREHYRIISDILQGGYLLDGKWVQMPVNCGGIYVNDVETGMNGIKTGVNTVYSCLTNAYEDSKYNHQGDFCEFEGGMTVRRQNKLDLINMVRNSVNDGCRNFVMYYQPIVNAKDESLAGAEALLRWIGPDGRVVGPDEFIPVLESDAMFPILGTWVLKSALEEVKPLLEDYPDFVINVNVSYAQLQQHDFVQNVLSALRETGFPARNLCLEITERARMLDMDRLININFRLVRNGVSFALDDFGTGFSSINILKHLKFRTVKLDRKFVMNVLDDSKEVDLVTSVTRMARIFGATTCVEGVEDARMRAALLNSEVDKMQGYYYSVPVPMGVFRNKFCSGQNETEEQKSV